MIGVTLAVSSALVASSTVSALVLPPAVLDKIPQGASIEILPDGVESNQADTMMDRLVRLPCDDCAPNKDGDMQLLFNFSVGFEHKHLYFNDVELSPSLDPNAEDTIFAPLISADESVEDFAESDETPSRIPVELRGPTVVREVSTGNGIGPSILELTYGVSALRHGRHLHNSKLKVVVIQDMVGHLALAKVAVLDDNGNVAVPVPNGAHKEGETQTKVTVFTPGSLEPGADCKGIMCDARSQFAEKFEELKIALEKGRYQMEHEFDHKFAENFAHNFAHFAHKPCNKHKRPHHQVADEGHVPHHAGYRPKGGDEASLAPPPETEEDLVAPVHLAAGHGKPHHHKHPQSHSWTTQAIAMAVHIIVPILFGVLVGLATYAVGVFVGCGIVWVWNRLFRKSKKHVHYEELPSYEDEEAYLDDVKTPGDAPPAYLEYDADSDLDKASSSESERSP